MNCIRLSPKQNQTSGSRYFPNATSFKQILHISNVDDQERRKQPPRFTRDSDSFSFSSNILKSKRNACRIHKCELTGKYLNYRKKLLLHSPIRLPSQTLAWDPFYSLTGIWCTHSGKVWPKAGSLANTNQ